jgi:predicted signal transduction protein with EAL and GGDEF domain
VANRLRNCLRQEDAVARFGGDEFAIMLTGIGSPHYASIVANKIISELNKPIYIKTQEVVVGVSIGITLAPHDGNSLSTLFKNADLAMYQAKDKGRNSFQFFTQDMNHEIADRLALEHDIKKALKNQEFILYFQPQVNLADGRIVGAEALIRWDHAERGLRSPLEFIPMAEETGLIVPLGKWILRAACQQAKSINKGLSLRVPISVNLSARQLADKSFVDTLSVVLQETKLDPSLLELEVTESLLMDNIDEVIEILGRIRDLGVRIAIDDFGTGYSSLSYIKRLPINRLKIDRTFIKDLPENQEDREITSLIVAMAKNLKLEVLAEGAETKPQVDLLTSLECDYSQGFYHSKPLPADQLMILLFESEMRGLKVAG